MNQVTTTERFLAAAAHASFLAAGIGFLLVPLLILIVWGKKSQFVAGHAKQALYMQIGAIIVTSVAILLSVFVGPLLATGLAITLLTFGWVGFAIVGAVKAVSGDEFVYPLLKIVGLN